MKSKPRAGASPSVLSTPLFPYLPANLDLTVNGYATNNLLLARALMI